MNPLVIAAIAVLVVNDHLLKVRQPGLVTGKLSDVAGLVFFPLLLQALWEVVSSRGGAGWRPSTQVLGLCCALTGLVFAAVKLAAPATELYAWGGGALRWPLDLAWASFTGASPPPFSRLAVTRDPTDLVALPALCAAWSLGRRRAR